MSAERRNLPQRPPQERRVAPERRDRMRRINTIHFVGIGGSGMSGIAEVLSNLGYIVQGSDLRPSASTERLGSGRGKLLAMAERARQQAMPRAAEELADSCLALARGAA